MINILQAPGSFYPAYNDSYIRFTTTYTNDDKALIKLTGTSYQFTIYPDLSGEYLFNLKNIVSSLINTNKFRDNLDTSGAGWGFTDNTLYKEIEVEIITYGDGGSTSVLGSYSFTKAVKQFGDSSFNNSYQLLLPSEDGINFYLKYFEGYPLDITFRRVNTSVATTTTNADGTTTTTYNNEITLHNKRTGQITTAFRPSSTAPYRLVIDKASTNWHEAGTLELPDMMSYVDILVDGFVYTSLELPKVAARPGTYLKWFNADGSYSYWLFNNWFKQEYGSKEIDRVSTNNFNNIYDNTQGITQTSGKAGESSIKLKSVVTQEEMRHLVSLIISPMVQMWSSFEPFTPGKWIDVKVVSNSLTYNSKNHRNQVSVEIELPEVNTQIL